MFTSLGADYNYNVNVSGGLLGTYLIVAAIAWVFLVVCWWRVFTKAGHPGWAAIIPIYNVYVMIKIAGRPGWWLVWILLPPVFIVIAIIVIIDVARNFGHGVGFGIGMLIPVLDVIFVAILAFGSSVYQPVVAGPRPSAPQASAPPPVPPPPPA